MKKMKKKKKKFFEETESPVSPTTPAMPTTNKPAPVEDPNVIETQRIQNFIIARREMLITNLTIFEGELKTKYRQNYNAKAEIFKKIKEIIQLIS